MLTAFFEQFIADHNIRLDILSGPETVAHPDGWDEDHYRLRLTSDHHSFDFIHPLNLAMSAEHELVAAPVLVYLVDEEAHYRYISVVNPPAEHVAAAQKKKGKDLVLLLGGEESYGALSDALDKY